MDLSIAVPIQHYYGTYINTGKTAEYGATRENGNGYDDYDYRTSVLVLYCVAYISYRTTHVLTIPFRPRASRLPTTTNNECRTFCPSGIVKMYKFRPTNHGGK